MKLTLSHAACWLPKRYLFGLLAALLSGSLATPSLAAERLTLRLGPLEQSIAIADLERFAKTGELSPALQPYAGLLTSDLRQVLSQRLELDADESKQSLEDLLRSPGGKWLSRALGSSILESSVQQVQGILLLLAQQTNGLNAIEFFKALPQENVTIDLSLATDLARQLNFPYLETQAIRPELEQGLQVKTAPVQTAVDPAAPGPHSVRRTTLTLKDQERDRTFPVEVYWSQRPQGPLVVISPGLKANRQFLAYLANHLASHGLTVAALEHPDGDVLASGFASVTRVGNSPQPLPPGNPFIERPRDVSFLLDFLTTLNRQSGQLQGQFNTAQVSVIGHSLGGYTALALAGAELQLDDLRQVCRGQDFLGRSPADWLQCAAARAPEDRLRFRDQRVVQAIALNPLTGNLFSPTGLAQVETPTLILSATEDTLTPALTQQLQPFTQLPQAQPKYLLTAIGGTHLSVGDPAHLRHLPIQTSLADERYGQGVAPLRQLLKGVTLALIQQLGPEAETYEPFLTAAYAQSLSTPDLALRLNTEFPASLKRLVQQ